MSEYLAVDCEYADEKLLREAIETVAEEYHIRPEYHEQGKEARLYGYIGDLRRESAQFVIRRQYLQYHGVTLHALCVDGGHVGGIVKQWRPVGNIRHYSGRPAGPGILYSLLLFCST